MLCSHTRELGIIWNDHLLTVPLTPPAIELTNHELKKFNSCPGPTSYSLWCDCGPSNYSLHFAFVPTVGKSVMEIFNWLSQIIHQRQPKTKTKTKQKWWVKSTNAQACQYVCSIVTSHLQFPMNYFLINGQNYWQHLWTGTFWCRLILKTASFDTVMWR